MMKEGFAGTCASNMMNTVSGFEKSLIRDNIHSRITLGKNVLFQLTPLRQSIS